MAHKRLNGKTVLITGAAKRIGREIALALAKEGTNILIHYRSSADEANTIRTELVELGVKAWLIKTDFKNIQEVETLISRSVELASSLDFLVNSASVFPESILRDMSFDQLIQNIQVNAWAPFILSRNFAKDIGQGKIINLLDTRISGYDRSHTAYILSKNMLAAMTKMMAIEFAPRITVNAVAPGLILPPPGKDQEYLDRLVSTVPLNRHGNPSDIAAAVIYLLTADFVTGEIIHVDGGRHLI